MSPRMQSHPNSPICLELDAPDKAPAADEPEIVTNAPGIRRAPRFSPTAPKSLAETGLPGSLIEQLVLKVLYVRGETRASDLARVVGLHFTLIEEMIEWHKRQQLVQVKGSSSFGPISAILSLTETGRRAARDYLEINQYAGPAPVPISQYAQSVQAQRMPDNWLTPERLAKAYAHMVVKEEILDQLGPAVNGGKSFLLYGQPGDGKTHLAEAVFRIPASNIYLPYALESQGNIIQLYDPLFHRLVEPEPESGDHIARDMQWDGRWAKCRRPFIVTGGELSLSMLDLSYNAVSKIYDAPYQLKANNGSYLIDDFGRQKAAPVEILNRWILPMEHRIDYLSFLNGGKTSVPFETFLIFSTNLTPKEIGDEAFLRRIQYKMLLPSPDEKEFRSIFNRFCESQNLTVTPALLDAFIAKNYHQGCKQFRRCHARDVISQAIDYIRFKQLPYELTADILDRAFVSCFGATG
jgi:predicted ATPase with chaperone activity